MKLSYPIATPEIDVPLLAYAGETEAMLAQLKAMGYQAIEPFVRDPSAFDAEAFALAVANSGLQVATIGTGPVQLIDQLVFTDPDTARRDAALDRAKSIVDFAARLGSSINVGKLRGPLGESPEEAEQRRDEAFREICRYAAQRSVIVTLEPQSRTMIDNLNTTPESLAWIEQMQTDNLFVMLDTFHMANEDPDPAASIRQARRWLRHVHFSDSDRLAPLEGSIDFNPIITALGELVYDGAITIEIAQKPDQATAARLARRNFARLLSSFSQPS